ncbi:MAG: serine/threonine-protein kinase [Planctomycetaceae bacterium]|nr:serine/threonine-protein kinase [Planctomycetaceae bacterium]
MKVTLTIMRPNAPVEKIEISEPTELLIGRVSQCKICLTGDGLVSRQHAVLEVNPPSVRINDLGSTNGLTINSVAYGGSSGIKRDGYISLQNGDRVMVGKTVIHVEMVRTKTVIVPTNGADEYPDELDTCPEAPTVPGYQLLQRLGTGGMGTVYLAREDGTNTLVAIKTMINRLAFNERMATAFNREIEVCKVLDHPNIVKFLGSGITPYKELYLVLEYVNGGNLAVWNDRYSGRKMPLEEAFAMLMELTDGMAYAHNLNFVHRDIKPHNILVEDMGTSRRAKLTDLGLAKNFENSGLSGLTASFTGGGTMAYMPPEQLTDFRDVRPSSDVFSLMATFYEMLCGKGPYNFEADQDEIRVVSTCDIVPITERISGLPPELVAIIHKSLQEDEEERFQNCGELLEALKNVHI